MNNHKYDVVIVGAGIGGCTVAIFYGRAGLRVALIDKITDIQAYKKLCTHFIQASAKPTMDRLGLTPQIEAAGGLPSYAELWTEWGWIRPSHDPNYPPHGYSLSREKLDPMLRTVAADTPGVDLFLGQAARELVQTNGRISGVITSEQQTKQTHVFHGRLIVAADGHYSKLAQLANVKEKRWENGRFGYFAYYKNVPLKSGKTAQVWFKQPDVAYAFPNEDDTTLLAYMPTQTKLADVKQDPQAALEQYIATLPNGPNLSRAKRISPVFGMIKGQFHLRPSVASGMALVGDAAASTDPLWGCGIGWAFQTAEWLADFTAVALKENQSLDKSLSAYKKKHQQQLRGHNWYNGLFANGRSFNWFERVALSAATKDERCAQHIHAFAARHFSLSQLFTPRSFIRALKVNYFQREAEVALSHQ